MEMFFFSSVSFLFLVSYNIRINIYSLSLVIKAQLIEI